MVDGLKALEAIKDIRLSHVEQDVDENFEGEWEYSYHEKDDGTVGENFPDEFSAIDKRLRALDVMWNKGVSIVLLKMVFISKAGVDGYNSHYPSDNNKLTQEEFDLLKEVLA